jgi:hypothetical protein
MRTLLTTPNGAQPTNDLVIFSPIVYFEVTRVTNRVHKVRMWDASHVPAAFSCAVFSELFLF